MATQIDWGLLRQAPNIAEAFTQGQAAGELQQRKKATQDILAGYAANPQGGVPNALAYYDPETFATLSQNNRQQTVADRQTADALRATQARATAGAYIRQNAPGGAVASSSPAPSPAQVNENGDIVVTAAKPAVPATPVSIADIFEQDADTAKGLVDFMGKLGENDRDAFAQKTGVAAAVSMAALNTPPEHRQAFIDEHAPLLKQAGWTDRELTDFEATDDNLHGIAAIGVGADKYMADQRQAKGQAVTMRGQDVSAATSRRGQDISASTARRGQDIGAATARSGQAVTMRGQDMAGASRVAPKPAQVALAKTKLTSLSALENQLNRVEAAYKKAKYKGPIAGMVYGGISANDAATDAAIANLSPLLRQLTRVPGEGATSDYEAKLNELGKPSRKQNAAAFAESVAGYRDLIKATRNGYLDLAGEPNPAPAARGFKVVR